MAVTITISGTPIAFPSSAAAPNWASALISFAQLVETALASAAGTYDVAQQVYTMSSNQTDSDVNITNLLFDPTNVLGFVVEYTITRSTDSPTTITESGSITAEYNSTRSTGSKWQFIRDAVGDANITFGITDAGQVQYTLTAVDGGSSHTGEVLFRGRAMDT